MFLALKMFHFWFDLILSVSLTLWQDILTCYSLILDLPTLEERLRLAFEIYSNGRSQCSKSDCLWLLRLLNSTCFFCGDKNLIDLQLNDLVDSIYTMSGKIDGSIAFDEMYSLLLSHPLLEMFISLQFQGRKLLAVHA